MDRASSKGIDEGSLTKGQLRKLNALRKSVGGENGERIFAAWLASQGVADRKEDENAATIIDTLWPLVQDGALAIPRGGRGARGPPAGSEHRLAPGRSSSARTFRATVEGGISPAASVCIDRPCAGMAAEHRRLVSVRWEMRPASRM